MLQEQPQKHRWLLWLTIVSVFVFLLSPVMLFRFRNRAVFNQRIMDLAAAGYPVSFDDMEARYVLPADVENAADVYQKAFLLYSEPNEMEMELLPVRGRYERQEDQPPYPQEVMEAVKQSLDTNREYLELLDQAARMEHCLFPRTRTEFGFDFEYLSPLKKAAQIITERNLYLAQTGQTDALLNSTRTCIGLAEALNQQPRLIEHLVVIAIRAMIADGLENSLNLTQFSQEQLFELQQSFRQMQENNSCVSSLMNERVDIIEYAALPVSKLTYGYGVSSISQKIILITCSLAGLKDKDLALLLDFYERWITITQLPYDRHADEMKKLETEYAGYNQWMHWWLQVLMPSCRIGLINLRVIGNLQCAETALAIERYRLKYNTVPESLEALVPEFIDTVYLDPFDGKPLRYLRPQEGGYTVYCIGEDGIDNGGLDQEQMSKRKGSRSAEYDHPFTVKH